MVRTMHVADEFDEFQMTETGKVYHLRDESNGSVRFTRCGYEVHHWLSADAPSILSTKETVREAVRRGLYCGNC